MPPKMRSKKPSQEWLRNVVAADFSTRDLDSAPIWAQAIQNGHVPAALQRSDRQDWSQEHMAKNFTALHTLTRKANMDRATSGALVAFMFDKKHTAITAGGRIETIQLELQPGENCIQLHVEYVYHGDVRKKKESGDRRKIELYISSNDLAPYRLAGIEGDTINAQELSQQVEADKALLDYDLQTQTLIVSHVMKIKRTSTVVPAEILGAEDLLTTAEQRLLMLTDSETARQSWLATLVADKAQGWEMVQIDDVTANEQLNDAVQKAINERTARYRKQWINAARKCAMKNILAAIEQQPMGFFAKLFGKKKYVINSAELKLDTTIERLSQKLPITVQKSTHWLRKMQTIGGNTSRLETKVEVHLSLAASARHRIADPRPGYEGKFISFETALRPISFEKVLSVPTP